MIKISYAEMKTIYSSTFKSELGTVASSLEVDEFIHPRISKAANSTTIEVVVDTHQMLGMKLWLSCNAFSE